MTAKRYMPGRITVVLMLLTALLPAQQQDQKQDEKPAFQLETFYMAIMSRADPYNEKQLARLAEARQAYWQRIADHGDWIVGGPVLVVKDTLADIEIYRAENKQAAEEIARKDPAVRHKLLTTLVLPWGTQKDFLPSLKKYDPKVTCYIGFLKRGPKFSLEDSPERQRIQEAHLKNIGRLHEMGKLVAAGPFLEDTDLRGIFVFKTASMEEANELTNTDPAIQAGRLRIELFQWSVPAEAFKGGR